MVRSWLYTLTCMFLTGCAPLSGLSDSYPTKWPTVQNSRGCPDLTGSYMPIGLYSNLPEIDSNNLPSRMRLGSSTSGPIILESSLGALKAIVTNVDGTKRFEVTMHEASNDFSCADGALVLRPIVQRGAGGTGGYRSERTLFLRRANDGSLIGEDRLFSVGAALWIVPIVGSQTYWYRWPLETRD